MQRITISLAMLMVLSAPALGQTKPSERDGPVQVSHWVGRLYLPGPDTEPVFFSVRIEQSSSGPTGLLSIAPSASISGELDIQIGEITLTENRISFLDPAPPVDNVFEFDLDEQGQGRGRVMIARQQAVNAFIRRVPESVALDAVPRRPQYRASRHVNRTAFFTGHGGVTLGGTVTTPHGDGPFPAVLLLADGSRSDRDLTIGHHRIFAVWAELLADRGIGSFRFDSRGVRDSGGDFDDATSTVFADDAWSGLLSLRSAMTVNPDQVGVLAIGEGAAIAAMLGADGTNPAFTVLINPSALPGVDQTLARERHSMEVRGESPDYLEAFLQKREDLLRLAAARASEEVLADAVRSAINFQRRNMRGGAATLTDGEIGTIVAQDVVLYSRPRIIDWLSRDPAEVLTTFRSPVLVMCGKADAMIPYVANHQTLRKSLVSSQAEITIHSFDGLNHWLQQSVTGLDEDHSAQSQTVDEEAVTKVADWIADVVSEKGD